MNEHDTVLSYLRARYGHQNVVEFDDSSARIRIKGRLIDVDLSTFIPFQTRKDTDA